MQYSVSSWHHIFISVVSGDRKNTMHLHIDEHIYSAAQICTHAHTESNVLSPAVSVSAITVSEYPASALTHSINLPLFDRNYAHLFSHSPHAGTQRLDVQLQASGLV